MLSITQTEYRESKNVTLFSDLNGSPADAPDVDNIAVFIPITAPEESSKGPPELPGLIAASVCIMLYIGFLLGDATCLPNPLTIPVVNVWSKPNGFPIAIAN